MVYASLRDAALNEGVDIHYNNIIIGDDENSYAKLTEAFRDRTIASYARVILLNPLSHLLPRAVVLLLQSLDGITLKNWKV